MIISVTERTREIGTRLAIGARRREVLGQFLIEAALLSTLGGAAGVLVALGMGVVLTWFVSGFSAVVPVWAIIAGLAASLGVGVTAGYWPASRAAGLDPIQALRYE
jgi:putative ABC transport system permease protein